MKRAGTDQKKLILTDNAGVQLFEGNLTSLPLNESLIITKSIEFFNDDSPCFIHRSAIAKRLYLELEEYLTREFSSCSQIDFCDIPREIADVLSGFDRTKTLKYC